MAVSQGRSVERSRLAWLSNRLPPPGGLAYERRASWPGPRRGVAQKRRERHGGLWNQACPPRSLPASNGKERVLLAAGERVLDVQPKLGARVRLLAAGGLNKHDPNDARSV